MSQRLLNIREVSDLLRVPVGTLYAWRTRGTGPKASKVGKHLRYRERDVEAWLDARANGAA